MTNKGRRMKVYISGAITGNENYKEDFKRGDEEIRAMGYIPYNPARIELPPEADYEEYMTLCLNMIEMCEAIYMLDNWQMSRGANREFGYAAGKDKIILWE